MSLALPELRYKREHPLRYIVVFLITWAVVVSVGYVGAFFTLSLSCNYTGYSSEYFLAGCVSSHFGDYEHGLFLYGLDPAMDEKVRHADVVFLGNSRAQIAFSTTPVRSYFARHGITHFVLGFGYGEYSPFALEVLKRIGAHPKMVIINGDPFFAPTRSPMTKDVLEGPPITRFRMRLKQIFQYIHAPICSTVPILCDPSSPTPAYFRSNRDGHWLWAHTLYDPDLSLVDVTSQRRDLSTINDLPRQVAMANEFLKELKLNRACVIVTGVPTPQKDSEVSARRLADALSIDSIQPNVEGLSTIDGDHLNLRSADLWSAAFVAELDRRLGRCVGTS